MAVDIQDLFNVQIPAKMVEHPDKAKEIGATFQINITGDGGGEWYIDAKDAPKCEKGNPGTAECTITISTDDFQKLSENPQANGTQLFFAGKLKVGGNTMLAMKLGKLFTLG